MTQENAKILLKDLSARFPYGVKGYRKWIAPLSGSPEESDHDLSAFDLDCLSSISDCGESICNIDGHVYCVEDYDFKPYLRPISSITRNEIDEFEELFPRYSISEDRGTMYHSCRGDLNLGVIDWLNSYHFDYRGLIPLGLALEAKEEIYK